MSNMKSLNSFISEKYVREGLFVELLKDRDPEAWRDFTKLYSPMASSMIMKYAYDGVDKEECLQETLTRISNKIDSFLGQSSLASWVCGVAKFTCFEYSRQIVRDRLYFCGKIDEFFDHQNEADAEAGESYVSGTDLVDGPNQDLFGMRDYSTPKALADLCAQQEFDAFLEVFEGMGLDDKLALLYASSRRNLREVSDLLWISYGAARKRRSRAVKLAREKVNLKLGEETF